MKRGGYGTRFNMLSSKYLSERSELQECVYRDVLLLNNPSVKAQREFARKESSLLAAITICAEFSSFVFACCMKLYANSRMWW